MTEQEIKDMSIADIENSLETAREAIRQKFLAILENTSPGNKYKCDIKYEEYHPFYTSRIHVTAIHKEYDGRIWIEYDFCPEFAEEFDCISLEELLTLLTQL